MSIKEQGWYLKQRQERLEQEIESLRKTKGYQSELLEKAGADIARLEIKNATMKQEIESLREQLDDERKHSDIIVQQRDEAIGDLSQAKEDIKSLRSMVEDQHQFKARQVEYIKELEQERDEWKRRAWVLYQRCPKSQDAENWFQEEE